MRAIATEGLTLEPQTAGHADLMFQVLSDPAIYEYENEPPQSLEWLRERFARLESRRSADGSQQWLNWVIRMPTSDLAGYVQATVHADGHAAIAYELASAYWSRGLARRAVDAVIEELAESYHVRTVTAVFKKDNQRSRRLLERLGFVPSPPEWREKYSVEADEQMMHREARLLQSRVKPRLVSLRRLRPADLDAFQAYRAIPELGRYQGWSPMTDPEALEFLSRMNEAPMFTPGEWLQLGIADRDSDELIGDIGIHLSEDGDTAELGFTLHPDAQGRGIATAAVREALQLLFDATSAKQVLGITDSRNEASIRLLERVGFRYQEARDIVFRGEPCCEKIYALARQ
jgi:RimJ/RimL family protein N-acetyltransferase